MASPKVEVPEWTAVSFEQAVQDLRLSMLARGTQLMVFVGAGASVESGVPLGDALLERVKGALSATDSPASLEAFLQKARSGFGPDEAWQRQVISDLLGDAGIPGPDSLAHVPSLLHLLVARLAAVGVAPVIISLNFDELLERCLQAEMGPPADAAQPQPSLAKESWAVASSEQGFDQVQKILNHPRIRCLLVKPHGNRTGELLAAAQDVMRYREPIKSLVQKALSDSESHLLFVGCSLRDSDFKDAIESLKGGVKARLTVFDVGTLKDWLKSGRKALDSQHPFDLNSMAQTPITYIKCDVAPSDMCQEGAGTPLAASMETAEPILRRCSETQGSVGQALLRVMESASDATVFLQERNAPTVSDISIHDWVRAHLPGKRPGPRSFLAAEILIAAAILNGTESWDTFLKTRGHLKIVNDWPDGAPLLNEQRDRFVSDGVLLKDATLGLAMLNTSRDEFLSAVVSLLDVKLKVKEEQKSKECAGRLLEFVHDLAENKAGRSNWQAGNPAALVGIEQATAWVLDTTDELRVVSEYGTWLRSPRFAETFLCTAERALKRGSRVLVIVASPPPPASQGYIEWVTSALWLCRVPSVELHILDAKEHEHHMNLGDQIAIDFNRKGIEVGLTDSRILFSHRELQTLKQEFKDYWDKSKSFLEWQMSHGLDITWGDVAVRNVMRVPLDRVYLEHNPALDVELDPKDEAQAQTRWDLENTQRDQAGRPRLEARPLFRPMDGELKDDRVYYYTGRTTYFKNYALARPSTSWNAARALGAGISVVPVCTDGEILVGKRSGVVAEGVGLYHVVGGHAHPTDEFANTPAQLIDGALEELAEEMHIRPDDLAGLTFLGLVMNLSTSKPEFVVRADLKEASKVYLDKANEAIVEEARQNLGPEFEKVTTLSTLLGGPLSLTLLDAKRGVLIQAAQGAILALLLSDSEYDITGFERQLG